MILDLTGYRCPLPVIRTEAALRGMTPGDQVLVRADDPLAALDIPHFCREAGHKVEKKPDEGKPDRPVCVFLVTRGPNP
ncbi:sulfurtransferase TusA family protein [Hyphococcus sp.]|uniref:sulfurtransferase TusA family protein n=1 Tax=Hyphococcus sp. TaxID=2038636 RepID=UPI003CCBACEE